MLGGVDGVLVLGLGLVLVVARLRVPAPRGAARAARPIESQNG